MYSSIVIIGGDDVAGSTACVCSGAVCVTGNTVAGKIIDGVPELITVVCDVVSWGSNVKVAFQVQRGDSEVLSGGGIFRSAMNSLLILVCALMVPLWGMVSRDQLSYACDLAAPMAASPWRKMMMSVLLVRWLRESNGVLGMAPVMMRSASAWILLSFLRLISVLIALIQILQQ